jgi:hypothetical protein
MAVVLTRGFGGVFLFSTSAYWPSFELPGAATTRRDLQQMTREKRWNEMPTVFADEVLGEFPVTGPDEAVADALRLSYAGLVNRIAIPVPGETAHDRWVGDMLAQLRRPDGMAR